MPVAGFGYLLLDWLTNSWRGWPRQAESEERNKATQSLWIAYRRIKSVQGGPERLFCRHIAWFSHDRHDVAHVPVFHTDHGRADLHVQILGVQRAGSEDKDKPIPFSQGFVDLIQEVATAHTGHVIPDISTSSAKDP